MRFKLDENMPRDAADPLTEGGHDVESVHSENMAGWSDPQIIAASREERRVLLTLDRACGDIREYPPGSHAGIVVLRPRTKDTAEVIELVQALIAAGVEDLGGCVCVVQRNAIRVRRPDE